MSLELLNTVAAIGTFVVIGTTAIAALVQLHHLRASNQLQGAIAILSLPYEAALVESFAFVWHELPKRLEDPEFRRGLSSGTPPDRMIHKELRAADYYERLGSMLKRRLFPEELYFDNSSPELAWRNLEPVVALLRRKRGPTVYENFEYLVARSRAWDRRHPDGAYPSDTPRLTIRDPWLGADENAGLHGSLERCEDLSDDLVAPHAAEDV